MQARLPPIGDEARVAALCARCVFDDNRGLFAALIACTFSGSKTCTERDNMTVIHLARTTIAASLATMWITGPAQANFLCNDVAAFEVCRALNPGTPDFSQIKDCMQVEQTACLAYADLSKRTGDTLSRRETEAVKQCGGRGEVSLHWLHQYDCLRNHIRERNEETYQRFLADRNLTNPDRAGRYCIFANIDPAKVEQCLDAEVKNFKHGE
ncbi:MULTISPECIES: hypothetical protein [unclassified Phaeobacter]|uniref:hypothetical protein n=1 Tax=unclassified Phaeobacter TaxID=2621772 RepID=UPI003A85B449